MNDKNIFDALRDIDEQWILDAAPQKRTSRVRIWAKWGAVAAGFFLLAASVLGAVLWLRSVGSLSPEPDQPPSHLHTHIFGEWKTAKEANCSEMGEEIRVCTCGEQERRLIGVLPHFAGAWVIEKEPTIKIPTPDNPTERESGVKSQFCEHCGAKLGEELIPAMGSLGLAYAINPDGKTFSVAGIGNCTDKEVIVPENFCGYHVTAILGNAFADCENITSVTLPDTVTVIGPYAFKNCKSLKSITIPKYLVEIGERAFIYCVELTEINLPQTVVTIGEGAFLACKKLESLTIPNQITVLSAYMFSGCESLKSVTLSDGLESIEERAFSDCKSLKEIDIPSSVTQIGIYAFERCSSLVRVDLPQGLTVIAESLFSGCSALVTVTISQGVTSIERNAFRDCYWLTNIEIPNSVTYIGAAAFYRCSSLRRIVIPEGVEVIERNLFNECTALREVVLPHGITSIGYYAFDSCKSLTSINLPSTLTIIDGRAFAECDLLQRVVIPEGVTVIAESAFAGCNQLREVVIPESVKRIRQKAFAGCNKLLQNENGVLYVGNWAVDFDKSVNEIVIRDGTVGIAEYTFFLIEDLVSITLPDSLRHIGGYAITFIRVGEWELIFNGTPEEWETIEKAYGWDGSSTYSMIFTNNAKQ